MRMPFGLANRKSDKSARNRKGVQRTSTCERPEKRCTQACSWVPLGIHSALLLVHATASGPWSTPITASSTATPVGDLSRGTARKAAAVPAWPTASADLLP